MPPDIDRVWVMAQAVKAAVEAGYTAAAVDLPERRFVSPGLPAWDCEIFAVQVEANLGHEGDIASEVLQPRLPGAGHTLRAIRVALHMIRCVPTVDQAADEVVVPTEAEEEDAAETILVDSQLMLNTLVAAQRAGDLPRCSGLVFEQWQNVGPEGGLGGGILRVRLGLE